MTYDLYHYMYRGDGFKITRGITTRLFVILNLSKFIP